MTASIHQIIGYLWLALLVVWILAALRTKRTVQAQSIVNRISYIFFAVVGYELVFNARLHFGLLGRRIVPDTLEWARAGLAITIAGMLFCVWARAVLGRNWSGNVTLKEDHTLARRGPYRIVRHPIYTGLITATLGTALVSGYVRCFMGVVIVAIGFWIKLRMEERFMVQQFGDEYTLYRRQVRALIPFLF